jgi:hypothetical protein
MSTCRRQLSSPRLETKHTLVAEQGLVCAALIHQKLQLSGWLLLLWTSSLQLYPAPILSLVSECGPQFQRIS